MAGDKSSEAQEDVEERIRQLKFVLSFMNDTVTRSGRLLMVSTVMSSFLSCSPLNDFHTNNVWALRQVLGDVIKTGTKTHEDLEPYLALVRLRHVLLSVWRRYGETDFLLVFLFYIRWTRN